MDDFKKHFAERLRHTLIEAGFSSSRSESGVEFSILTKITSCSKQMARRYVMGTAFPDPNTIKQVADYFDVSAGWLLFGEQNDYIDNSKRLNNSDLLLSITLKKLIPLLNKFESDDQFVEFFIDVLHDINNIDAQQEEIIKLIDMMVKSVLKINNASAKQRRGLTHDNLA